MSLSPHDVVQEAFETCLNSLKELITLQKYGMVQDHVAIDKMIPSKAKFLEEHCSHHSESSTYKHINSLLHVRKLLRDVHVTPAAVKSGRNYRLSTCLDNVLSKKLLYMTLCDASKLDVTPYVALQNLNALREKIDELQREAGSPLKLDFTQQLQEKEHFLLRRLGAVEKDKIKIMLGRHGAVETSQTQAKAHSVSKDCFTYAQAVIPMDSTSTQLPQPQRQQKAATKTQEQNIIDKEEREGDALLRELQKPFTVINDPHKSHLEHSKSNPSSNISETEDNASEFSPLQRLFRGIALESQRQDIMVLREEKETLRQALEESNAALKTLQDSLSKDSNMNSPSNISEKYDIIPEAEDLTPETIAELHNGKWYGH